MKSEVKQAAGNAETGGTDYVFKGGFPTADTIRNAYDAADLNRAIQAYRFFFPTVSGVAIFKGNAAWGLVPNKTFGVLDTQPKHLILTANSDTPYGPILLDLSAGPMVVELPPGPLVTMAMTVDQRWVADMGVPGPDEGKGGKHLFLAPDYTGDIPTGYHVWRSTTLRVLVGVRAIPIDRDVDAALKRIQTIQVHPLHPAADWSEPNWLNLTDKGQDTTPLEWETSLQYWKELHEFIDTEPPYEGYRTYYGELGALGIVKGKPFAPDRRMQRILERAALLGNAQMRVQAFADRRPDCSVWADRKWEWVALRPESGDFSAGSYVDLDAREVWFYQAIGASPAMFRRKPGSGSLYWLGLRDQTGAYLDGGQSYVLKVPSPVPAELFWSVTVYDAQSRTEIQTDQGKAALRSLFELASASRAPSVDLHFGPQAPAGAEERWIKTRAGRGWFSYLRIYGPRAQAFDGSWKPGDFEQTK